MTKISPSLATRWMLTIVFVVIATALGTAIPATLLIRQELDRQAQSHLVEIVHNTESLLAAEAARLTDIAEHAAARPSIQDILLERNAIALDAYLQVFRESLEFDRIAIYDEAGRMLASDPPGMGTEPPLHQTLTFQYIASPSPEYHLLMLAQSPIFDRQRGGLKGFVTIERLIDDAFLKHLASQTGLQYSLIIGRTRIASSEPSIKGSREALPAKEAEDHGDIAERVMLGGHPYLVHRIALTPDKNVGEAAFLEMGLPIDTILFAERRALVSILIVAVLAALAGASIAGSYARRVTSPLSQLTKAARDLGQGKLSRPMPLISDPPEIASLSEALESSRLQLREALAELASARDWLNTIIQSISEGILTLDTQGRIVSFNRGAENVTGYSREDVEGRRLDSVLRLAGDYTGLLSDHLPGPQQKRLISILSKDGDPLSLEFTTAQLAHPSSGSEFTALVLRDITEEEAARHLRSQFLASITHEFRTPLAAINASVELILSEIQRLSAPEVSRLLRAIHMSVSGLQTLIDNLLESHSIEAGYFTIQRRRAWLPEIIQDAYQTVRPLMDRRDQTLETPQMPEDLYLYVDPVRIKQVIVNLLSNASKYGPVGEPIEIGLEISREGEIKISIADRGPGISEKDRSRIFRRFVRSGGPGEMPLGVGLGLSVVKVIIEEHGGRVGVQDRPGGGSVFWFTLPSSEERR